MTTTEPAGAATVPIGPPPPFDPELAAGLAAAAEMAGEAIRPSFTPDEIPTLRQSMHLQPVSRTECSVWEAGPGIVDVRAVFGEGAE